MLGETQLLPASVRVMAIAMTVSMVLSCCGIPPELGSNSGAGKTAIFRRFARLRPLLRHNPDVRVGWF